MDNPKAASPTIDEATIANMRLRVERCRFLANSCGDKTTAAALHAMADEGEADIARLMDRGGD